MNRSSAEPPTSPADADADFHALLRCGPFHEALRAAIRRRGLTLDRLRWHLAQRGTPVALSTLSGWQHGHVRPGRAVVVRALEEVLKLPGSTLVGLLDNDADGADPRRGETYGSAAVDDLVAELYSRLRGTQAENSEVLARHDTAVIDAERRATSLWTRLVLRAQADGVDRCHVVFVGDAGCDVGSVQVRARANCSVGRVLRHSAGPVMVTELLLGEALRTGDICAVEYEQHAPVTGECTGFAHVMKTAEAHYVQEVRFDPAALPIDCHAYTKVGRNGEPRRIADLPLRGGHAIRVLGTGAGPGLTGIAWRWPGAKSV